MFRRCVAKSVDAVSRIAIKRACKFVLKKKLGHLILGEIDLHQLDVQLSRGLILLSDLALNVDFLNQKLSQTSILRVREGSIGCLSVKLPWSSGGFQVEISDLELVLCPLSTDGLPTAPPDSADDHAHGHDYHDHPPDSLHLHQGVKTVAKWLQDLLTSFHLTIQNLIVAFDPCDARPALVLRVTQIEGGTSISQNNTNSIPQDLFGISHFTNFLKFQGAVVDLLHINDTSSKSLIAGAQAGGFGGTLELSIPCKNGSLDVRKVDAQVRVDPLIAKLQPTSLNWILDTWDMLQDLDDKMPVDAHLPSSSLPSDKTLETENPLHSGNLFAQKPATDALLKDSQFIPDWIPLSTANGQTEGFEEADLGASVDQFFECLDGMRNSHSMLGSSGVWSWTSSVFSAITATSNIASGSLNISPEQQHVQTSLKITFVGVSAFLSLLDEDDFTQSSPTSERPDTNPNVHHVGSIWEEILVAIQVLPQNWKFEATVNHIVLNEYVCQKGDSVNFLLHDHVNHHSGQTLVIRNLQDKVQRALPYSSMFGEASSVKDSGESRGCSSNIVTTTFFETYGASLCKFAASSGSSDGSSTRRASSLSLKLPPFIFWLSSDLVDMVLDFVRKFEHFSRNGKARSGVSSEVPKEQASARSSVSRRSDKHNTSTSHKEGFVGNVLLPHGRIILCFPLSQDTGLRSCSWNEFIAFDFSTPLNLMKLTPEVPAFGGDNTQWKQDYSPSDSMHINVAKLDVYHLTSLVGDNCNVALGSSEKLCASRILSLGNGADWIRLISMLWHANAVTGAWVKKSAKLFSTSDGPPHKMSSNGHEFASVSSSEHREDFSSLKKKLVLSSKFCLNVGVPFLVVTLSRSQYLSLFNLANQAIIALSFIGNDTDHEIREMAVSQTSILVECGQVEIHMELSQEDCPKSSLQRELPGSWHSLRLEVRNLELLYVSDIGAVSGARFLWLSHCEGNLWGSIPMGADQDFLLISFSNSSNGRGDGEGSNVLSYRPAGSEFVHMSDPDSSHDFISIVLKCGTIVAPGGRLDWLDKVPSFFSLPSPEVGLGADCASEKGDSERLSFVIKFLDAALSYEPYIKKTEVNEECLSSRSHVYVSVEEEPHVSYVACLLAASSVMLSNTMVADSHCNDYSIRLQDVGLLLHDISRYEILLREYSACCLREVGYVKVAGEALVSAILRINNGDDIFWELWCSETHIVLCTCHDTTLGLIRLASQIQQLFAPDIEESLIHLENRWNSFQEAQGRDDLKGSSETCSSSSPGRSQSQHWVRDSKDNFELAGLMGEICEDAFLLRGEGVGLYNGSQLNMGDKNDGGPNIPDASSESFLEVGHTKREIMEGYCLSDLRSLSELAMNSHFGDEIPNFNLVSSGSADLQKENSGWYGRTPVSIVENYVADGTERTCLKQFVECQLHDKEHNGSRLCKGRINLKNAEVRWQMYAGSDWHELGQSQQNCGRDGSVCLELLFSNMNIQYDIFPEGDICASKICISVQDFHLCDQSKNAPWKLVLGYYYSKEHPRESLSKALKLDLEAVRPDPLTPLEEYRLRIAVLPILLHLHQSQLDFLVGFFGNKSSIVDGQGDTEASSLSADEISDRDSKLNGGSIADEALLPFFQKFDIWPIVVRVDYCPSRVDLAALSSGKYVELVNLVPWKGVELKLKHVQAAGVYGWSNVCETAIGEWLEDISQNQIHKLLRGLPTIRSFVAVGSGAANFLSLPVKNYRKDYKLVKGLQRGTISFLRSISVEALGLGVHLVAGAHDILLHAECILTRMQPSVPRPVRGTLKLTLEQPQDTQHGLQQAYASLTDGFEKSASAVIHNPMKTYRRNRSAGSALVTAFKGAPAAALAPASAAAQALHVALVGVRNSLDPERKKESMNKYLGPYHSSRG